MTWEAYLWEEPLAAVAHWTAAAARLAGRRTDRARDYSAAEAMLEKLNRGRLPQDGPGPHGDAR